MLFKAILLLAPYMVAFFGSVLYNAILFVIAKNQYDDEDKEFPYVKYVKKNIDNWGLTFLVAPAMVWYTADIIYLLNSFLFSKVGWSMEMREIYYMGAGPLTEVLIFAVLKLMGWKKSFITPVHKEN